VEAGIRAHGELAEDVRRLDPANPLGLASVLATLGRLCYELGRYGEAEQALRECVALRARDLAEDAADYWLLANSRNLLGVTLVAQVAAPGSTDAASALAKLAEAEPLLLGSSAWLSGNADRVPQSVRADRLRQGLERNVLLYATWDAVAPGTGKAERAAEWRAELERFTGP
jgi:hypothetical protein